jgi:NADPH-dependent 2,4-dienoyl-CoA reductase/sulfur reductase-like enzyme
MDRRSFVQLLAAGTAGTLLPNPAEAALTFKAVIVGGGMAGATAAKFLRMWGGAGVSVTLIDSRANYQSCIMSNKVITGHRTLDSLTYNYRTLRDKYGVRFVKTAVTGIDAANRRVTCGNGTSYAYDRLILAPGIDFDYSSIPGMDAAAQAAIPHAWKAGPQTVQLRDQLAGMTNGANFILTIPKSPYRCPPGPYERACVIADWMRLNKPASKLIVLDTNGPKVVGDPYSAIQAEPINFTNAFKNIHHNIAYHSDVVLNGVDATAKTIDTSLGVLPYGVLNLIPPQMAGKIVMNSGLGLANVAGRWAGVNLLSYESTAVPRIHVIGDSHASTQPKAGHIGNQEAKVCVDAIIRLQKGLQPYGAPKTNSACYTPITASTATWLTAVFAYDPATSAMTVVGGKASEPVEGPTKQSYEQMNVWFRTLMADTFA